MGINMEYLEVWTTIILVNITNVRVFDSNFIFLFLANLSIYRDFSFWVTFYVIRFYLNRLLLLSLVGIR